PREPAPERDPDQADRLREELQPDRRPEVHVPRALQGAQDADPPGGRAALRRPRDRRERLQGSAQGEAARLDQGLPPGLQEGDRPGPRGRDDPDLRGGSGLVPVRKYKPTSAGRRFMSVSTFDEVTNGEREKSLTEPLTKKGGRNVYGRVTT